jgi:hypothetical protein
MSVARNLAILSARARRISATVHHGGIERDHHPFPAMFIIARFEVLDDQRLNQTPCFGLLGGKDI